MCHLPVHKCGFLEQFIYSFRCSVAMETRASECCYQNPKKTLCLQNIEKELNMNV